MTSRYPILGKEKIILKSGHTLSLVEQEGAVSGFVGYSYFEGIDLYRGPTIYTLEFKTRILRGRRWAAAIPYKGGVSFFCTKSIENIWEVQEILRYSSPDGFNFQQNPVFSLNGSAPFIWKDQDLYYLYYHRRKKGKHFILARVSGSLEGLMATKEIILLESDMTLSAPSMILLGERYWLTTELKHGGQWATLLYKGSGPLGPFIQVEKPLLIDDRACAFQQQVQGKLVLTYSKRTGPGWDIRIKEGK